MLPWEGELAGRLDRRTVVSELLRDNPLADPHERPLWVYVPPGYDDGQERYPAVYVMLCIQSDEGHALVVRLPKTPELDPERVALGARFASPAEEVTP